MVATSVGPGASAPVSPIKNPSTSVDAISYISMESARVMPYQISLSCDINLHASPAPEGIIHGRYAGRAGYILPAAHDLVCWMRRRSPTGSSIPS